ncbi:MAG: hypothetical protein A2X94_11475 [Bdellovibrionales bacterium GWB1_55_8]|nr:MAG: hypothetical protein A2X94_11475 [Bdellovibrionales bacterium GWB1_55_8]
MDGYNEKKWFVYLSDHHEGPFSLAELKEKLGQHQIVSSSFVWCEGMPDWKAMTDVPECETLLASPPPEVPTFGGPDLQLSTASAEGPQEPEPEPELESLSEPTLMSAPQSDSPQASAGVFASADEPAELSSPGLLLAGASANDEFSGFTPQAEATGSTLSPGDDGLAQVSPGAGAGKSRRRGRFLVLALFLAALAGGGFAFTQGYLDMMLASVPLQDAISRGRDLGQEILVKASDRIPALSRWVSPLPQLSDVSPDEYAELKHAAQSSDNPANLMVAVALSLQDPTLPTFYVSSFLPDGAEFDLFIEGIPETLLNHLNFRQRLRARIGKRLARSDVLRLGAGLIPRGKYRVTVMEAETQAPEVAVLLANSPGMGVSPGPGLPKGRKLIVSKTYFLGGAEDENYALRLKEFHDKLRERAGSELSEVNQFTATLENQLTSSLSKFSEMRKLKKLTPVQKRSWEAFHYSWSELFKQISANFGKWTPEALQREYFYGVLYRLTGEAGVAVLRMHELHHSYFTGKTLPKAFEIQAGEAEASARTALTTLKAKIEQAQSMASSATIPKREGL